LSTQIIVETSGYSLSNSDISADPIALSVNENSTISVTLFDNLGNLISIGGEDVEIFIENFTAVDALLSNGVSSNAAFISAIDQGNGTYTAKLTSFTENIVTVGFMVNGTKSPKTLNIEFRGGNVTLVASISSATKKAKIGDLVKYTAVIENIGAVKAGNFNLSNIVPFGFSYVDNSIYTSAEHNVSWDKSLDISNLTLSAGEKIEIVYMLRVGAGAKRGTNTVTVSAYDTHAFKISNTASARIEITDNDPIFDDTLIIGTVFNDKNGNMIQDEDEEGLLGVRVVTIEGYIITTDQYGRFHLLNVKGGEWGRGRNFIMKIDPSSLPKGFKFTTANPLTRRITPGIPVRFDFGVKFPNEIKTMINVENGKGR
jgi:uncharacterized repeat protein (TIGR01451 family)